MNDINQDIPQPRIQWEEVENLIATRFGKENPDLKTILFLVGLRELGQIRTEFTKEEKQDLMNLALCKAFSISGFFASDGVDADGWPLWKQAKALPKMAVKEQEAFIRQHILLYFENENFFDR